jgi:hypothetical protein
MCLRTSLVAPVLDGVALLLLLFDPDELLSADPRRACWKG